MNNDIIGKLKEVINKIVSFLRKYISNLLALYLHSSLVNILIITWMLIFKTDLSHSKMTESTQVKLVSKRKYLSRPY